MMRHTANNQARQSRLPACNTTSGQSEAPTQTYSIHQLNQLVVVVVDITLLAAYHYSVSMLRKCWCLPNVGISRKCFSLILLLLLVKKQEAAPQYYQLLLQLLAITSQTWSGTSSRLSSSQPHWLPGILLNSCIYFISHPVSCSIHHCLVQS